MKVLMRLEKETSGAVRYQEIGEDGLPKKNFLLGTLYMRKSELAQAGKNLGGYPKGITLEIAFED